MAEADLHLKLDRILAGQAEQRQATASLELSIVALTTGLGTLSDDLATQRELLARLAEAASSEQDGGEMRDLIVRIEASLAQIKADGGRMVTVLNGLPRAVSDAAIDGIRLAMGEGVDVPPRGPGG